MPYLISQYARLLNDQDEKSSLYLLTGHDRRIVIASGHSTKPAASVGVALQAGRQCASQRSVLISRHKLTKSASGWRQPFCHSSFTKPLSKFGAIPAVLKEKRDYHKRLDQHPAKKAARNREYECFRPELLSSHQKKANYGGDSG
jgi:hypothetical protein